MTEPNEPRKRPRRTLKSLAWGSVAALGLGFLVTFGVPLSSVFFPSEEIVSCTVASPASTPRGRRGGNIFPRVYTDCGVFRSAKQATCTADPALRTQFIPGFTYDLTVRGAELPFTTSREIVSATVSPQQDHTPREFLKPLEPNTDDERLNEIIRDIQNSPENRAIDEKIAELEKQFAPETLRAFDYEQPAFSPECDVSRNVMTSIGIQFMRPDLAQEALTLPEGTVARDPLLPCEGYPCSTPMEPVTP